MQRFSLMTSYQSHGHPINHGLPAGSTSSIFSEIKMKRRQLLFKQNCSLSELLLSPHRVAANYLHEFSILTKINWITFSKAHLLLWPGVIFLWMSPTLSNLWSTLNIQRKTEVISVDEYCSSSNFLYHKIHRENWIHRSSSGIALWSRNVL